MESVNRFSKPIVSDIDYTDVDNLSIVFPTLNCRIFNKKGQGFIATNIESNEEAFELSTGYVAIGVKEFNGILYIISSGVLLGNEDNIEIGTYPSPTQLYYEDGSSEAHINTALSGFEQVYKPIGNLIKFNDGVRRRFRLIHNTEPYLNWTVDNPVDIKIKESYDGSVDLYICDNVHPNKVINSGFDQDGIYTSRTYTLEQLSGYTDLIPSTNKPMNATLSGIEIGGNLRPGMYYLFFKYVTNTFASTKYCTELGPIQVSIGTLSIDTQGVQEKDWLNNIENNINKKILINLSGVDQAYDYIQIGVLRNSSFIENGQATTDTYLIDKYYKINDTNIDIEITGNETQSILTIDDIIENTIPYNISKGQNGLDGRLLGVSWKRQYTYTDDIRTHLYNFAQLIVPQHNNYGALTNDNNETNTTPLPQYKDPLKVENDLGYFKGEVYPFGVKFVFNNGYISESFPIQSVDGMGQLLAPDVTKGLYRFPDYDTIYGVGNEINFAAVLGISFDTSYAIAYKIANPTYFSDIIGFFFVRGDRIENMVGQGLMINVTNKINQNNADATHTIRYLDGNTGGDAGSAKYIPVIKYLDGSTYYVSPPEGLVDTSGNVYTYSADGLEILNTNNKFALYIPDYIFTEDYYNEGDTYYLKVIRNNYEIKETTGSWRPQIYKSIEAPYLSTVFPTNYFFKCGIFNVNTGSSNGNGNFVSLLKDGRTYDGSNDKGYYVVDPTNSNFYQYNRSVYGQKYVGVSIDLTDTNWLAVGSILNTGFNRLITAIYKQENNSDYFTDVLSNFDVSTEEYQKISRFISFDGYVGQIENCQKGDCFWQNTFIRALRWYGGDDNPNMYDGQSTPVYYYHGLVLGFWSENKVNTAMRNDVRFIGSDNSQGLYSYYPKILTSGRSIIDWLQDVNDSSQIEATQINDGYNVTSSPVKTLGYDDTINLTERNKKNRIYYSDKQIIGSQVDAFRNIGVNNYQDFTIENNDFTDIHVFKGKILGVLRNTLIEIFADERILQKSATGDDLIAAARNYISDRYRVIDTYGGQQKQAIISTSNAIYGFDWLRKIFWRVTTQTLDTGGTILVSENLTKTKGVQSEFELLLRDYVDTTDITYEVDDNPLLFTGVHLGYDKTNNEILITLLKEGDIQTTYVYSENVDGFTGNYSFTPVMYANINNDFFSCNGDSDTYLPTSKFYKHNVIGQYQSFYEEKEPFQLSFIVNGKGSDERFSLLHKVFDALQIEMGEQDLESILYETEYQSGTYQFNTIGDVDAAVYEDNNWKIPVIVTVTHTGNQYEDDSELMGRWLKITLTYNPTTDAEAIYIKKVITNFQIML